MIVAGRGNGSRLCVVLLLVATLAGCESVADLAGAGAGILSGAATANPAVGVGVGVAVRAAANEGMKRVAKARQRNEQEAIAALVADMEVGETRAWAVDQRFVGDHQGEVSVIRLIETPLAACKEIAFSVLDNDGNAEWFTTTACEDGGRWRWAAAEPAVARWINLQ